MSSQYKLTDDEFAAALRAKWTDKSGQQVFQLFYNSDGSIDRPQTLDLFEVFAGFVPEEERRELLANRWRVGSKVPINVYEGGRPVCQCHTAVDAARIVAAMNRD